MSVTSSNTFFYPLAYVDNSSLDIDLQIPKVYNPPSGVTVNHSDLTVRWYFPKSTDLIQFGYVISVNGTTVASNNDNSETSTAHGGVQLQLYASINESYYVTLPEDCLTDGTETITVGMFALSSSPDIRFVQNESSGTYGNFRISLEATVSSFNNPVLSAVSNTVIDNTTVLSWTSDTEKTESLFNLYLNSTVINTQTITGSSVSFAGGTLSEGSYTFKVKDRIILTIADMNGRQLGFESTEATKDFTLSKIYPVIYALEPDGINQNRGNNITVTWSGANSHSFKLDVLQGGSVIKTFSGTTQTQLLIPANSIPAGTTQLILYLTYNGVGYSTTVSKASEFLAYGNPSSPTQDGATLYNTAMPTFTWSTAAGSSDTPISWQLQLLQGTTVIEDTGEVLGNAQTYSVVTSLTNHTEYIVKVKVKNQFALWSDWSTKTITIEYTDLPQPTFEIVYSKNSVVLNIQNTEHLMFKNSEVWRKESGSSTWVRLAYNLGRVTTYTDNTMQADTDYDYKVRSIASDGAISESVIKTAKTTMEGFEFVNVEDFSNTFTVYRDLANDNVAVGLTYNYNTDATVYAGNIGATIETDDIVYKTLSFEFELSFNDYNTLRKLLNSGKVILYRDERGHKCYGHIYGNVVEKHVDFNGYNISFSFIEVNFLEQDIYSGDGGLRIAYLNGQYLLDASTLLTGTVVV